MDCRLEAIGSSSRRRIRKRNYYMFKRITSFLPSISWDTAQTLVCSASFYLNIFVWVLGTYHLYQLSTWIFLGWLLSTFSSLALWLFYNDVKNEKSL